LITFVKTNRVDHVPAIVTSETGLSTATVITNEAVFLIQAGHFHKMAALVPNSFAFDNIARDRQELAVRTKISFALPPLFIPIDRLLGEPHRPSHKLAIRTEEGIFDEVTFDIVRKRTPGSSHFWQGD